MILILLPVLVILAICTLQAFALVHPVNLTQNIALAEMAEPGWQSVAFETDDSLTLRGWFIPPTRDDGATLLFVHGLAGSRLNFIAQLDYLLPQGYGALLFDLRNHGESDGRVTTLSNHEIKDVLAAYNFLTNQQRIQPDRIVVFGQSMGGATSIRSMPQLPQARGLIIDTAYTSMHDVVADGVRSTGVPPLFIDDLILLIANVLSGSNLYQARPIDVIADIAPRPILFIHGTADATIPVQHIYDLHEAAADPKDLLIIDGAGHVIAYQTDPDAYSERVLRFLDEIFSNA